MSEVEDVEEGSFNFKRWLIVFVVVLAACLFYLANLGWSPETQTTSDGRQLPFGVGAITGGHNIRVQDFAINLNYLRQVSLRLCPHPYRLADQEEIIKHWIPFAMSGMPHGYSPVALVVAYPLLQLPERLAFQLFDFLNVVLLVVLTACYLLPRISNGAQGAAVLASFLGYSLANTIYMGQTSVGTTCTLALGMVLLHRREEKAAGWGLDIALALILWVLAAKPSIAIVLATLLLGSRAWRALTICAFFLLATWLALSSWYGGIWSGLQDYFWLLNHYCRDDMTPFMQRGMNPAFSTNLNAFLTINFPALGETSFTLSRFLVLGGLLLLIALRWMKLLTLSGQFQGALWIFLLFSPYIAAPEDWVICLLAVEGIFFRPGWLAVFKVVLVFLIVNLQIGLLTHEPWFFPAKLTLAVWWLADAWLPEIRRRAGETASNGKPVTLSQAA